MLFLSDNYQADGIKACIVRKKAKIRNRYNQVSHLTQDTIWESDKNTIKPHTEERRVVSPFPAGDYEAARNGQDSMTQTKTKHKLLKGSTKEAPPWNSPKCLMALQSCLNE